MSVLIISLLCEHSELVSWAYEFVPMTFGKRPFLFILVFPFFAMCTVWAAAESGAGIQVGDGSLLYPRDRTGLGMRAGAHLNP